MTVNVPDPAKSLERVTERIFEAETNLTLAERNPLINPLVPSYRRRLAALRAARTRLIHQLEVTPAPEPDARPVTPNQRKEPLMANLTNKSRRPSLATLKRWESEGGCKTTDGCWVDPDGTCEHGKESWLLVLGIV